MHCDKLSETKSTEMVDEGEKNTDFKYYSLNFIHSAWKVLIKCIEYNYKYKFIIKFIMIVFVTSKYRFNVLNI